MQLDDYINRSLGGKKSKISTERMLETLNDVKSTLQEYTDTRKEKIFTRNIAQASIGGVSKFSKEQVKIFYGATQKLWEGLPIEKRNEAIKNKLGVDTLEEAWDLIYSKEEVQELTF